MTRHILSCATAIVLTAVLIACGGNSSSPTPTASNTPPATTPPAATPPPTTPPPTTPPSAPTPPPTPAPSSTPSCNYSYATFKGSDGNDASFLYGINDNGAMVGTDSKGGFVFQNGQFTYLNVPASFGATNTAAAPSGIANNGLVTGTYSTGTAPETTTHGFIYNNGQYTSFDAINSSNTFPSGISSDGTVVGTGHLIAATYGSDWIRHPDGSFATLADGLIPEGLRTPGDVNDSDVVVLDATASPAHRNDYATWQNGAFSYHPFPSAISSGSPFGNNNLGDIVGITGNNGVITAWALLGSSTSCAIAYPGAASTFAEDINGSRVIVGHYTTDRVTNHAFIATPK